MRGKEEMRGNEGSEEKGGKGGRGRDSLSVMATIIAVVTTDLVNFLPTARLRAILR